MAKSSECPDPGALRKLVVGELQPPALDSVAEHMESCADCLAHIQTLLPTDTLVQALAQANEQPAAQDSAIVQRLIAKLKAISSSSMSLTPEAIAFTCTKCGKSLKTKSEYAGKKVKCPKCGQAVVVPSDEANDVANQTTMEPQKLPLPEPRAGEVWDFLAPAQAPDEIGQLGPYRILQVLGKGGMGVVFRAEDTKLKRIVALKAMLPTIAAGPSAKKRFFREAQMAANIKHDHIVTIHQVDEDRGVPYLAMEFLQGEPLDVRLKREGSLPIAEVLRIGSEIAEGLAAAHEAGLMHRDIKPANIWLERRPGKTEDRVKILDFGLARPRDDQAGLTQMGAIVGTPAYMAPEQGKGGDVDSRCDLFSLGCALYLMTTGQLPFQGADPISTLIAVATFDPPPPTTLNPDVPPALSNYIMNLLAKAPEARPQSAMKVASTLRSMQTSMQSSPSPLVPEDTAKIARQMFSDLSDPVKLPTDVVQKPYVKSPKVRTQPPRRLLRVAIAASFVVAAALIAGVIFLIPTDKGTIRVEINDDNIEVVLTKTGAKIKGSDKQHDVVVSPGEQMLKVKRGDLEFETNKFVLKKGETVTVKVEFLKGKLAAVTSEGKMLGSKGGTVATPIKPPPMAEAEWFKAVAAMPAEKQVEAVEAELKRRNLNVAGPMAHQIKDGKVVMIGLPGIKLTDISPVRVLKDLRDISWNKPDSNDWDGHLADITPLQGMKLTRLDLSASQVTDLSPLRGMPLKELFLRGIKSLSDLTPLKGMKLTKLDLCNTEVKDLTPLAGMPLESLELSNQASDLSPLKGMPLTTLHCWGASDLTPLKGMKLENLWLVSFQGKELSLLREMPLKEIVLDITSPQHAELLRAIKTLETINGKPAKEVLDAVVTSVPSFTSLQFKGPSSYAQLEKVTLEDDKPFTLEAWVLSEASELRFHLRSEKRLFHLMRMEDRQWHWLILERDGGVKAQGIRIDDPTTIGKWSHIAATYEGKTLALYIDGKPITGTKSGRGVPNIERWPSFVGIYKQKILNREAIGGQVAGCRISKGVRYRDAFTPARNWKRDEDTIALYPFNEGAGDVLKDASGNGRDAKLVGATWVGPEKKR